MFNPLPQKRLNSFRETAIHVVCFGLVMVSVLNVSQVSAELIGGEELKDPTRPVDRTESSDVSQDGFFSGLFGSASALLNSNYKVSFIRVGGAEPIAMVNEQLVKTGDSIGAAQVVSIETDSVSLLIDGVVQRVASFNDTVKIRAEPQ